MMKSIETDIYRALVIAMAVSVISETPKSLAMIDRRDTAALKEAALDMFHHLGMHQSPIDQQWLIDDAVEMLLDPQGFRFLRTMWVALSNMRGE